MQPTNRSNRQHQLAFLHGLAHLNTFQKNNFRTKRGLINTEGK